MKNSRNHIVVVHEVARKVFKALDELPDSVKRTLFVIDENNHLMGHDL